WEDMRAVFTMHGEPLTVVARADSGIEHFTDFPGKRVNIGNPGSGQRATMGVLMEKMGWKNDTFSMAAELRAAEQSKALCDNKIDVMIYAVGHPNGAIKEATTSCDSVLVNVNNSVVQQLVKDFSYYRMATIPAGMYRGNDVDTATFGVAATLVTSADVPEDVIYNLVKAVFENFDSFQRLHPAFENLSPQEMVKDGLSAPLHPGALKYFKEAGLIK
ncbi:MAG: TAXI family TRAP transporter solute-binding subunit, partial [Gammaproteobacteria bacterium]|nr:TAXI family TRAP transporter solute-binding subunit [Gammaproteobacteria bacterium]